jgi:thiol-disulfide isomerase/thioredoxin
MLDPLNPPKLSTERWFNTDSPPDLETLKGRVVVIVAFQTHCPGSNKWGMPQAQRLANNFSDDEVAVIGLNTAFEELGRQDAKAIEGFIALHGLTFPVAKDKPQGRETPVTMAAYELQGTPAILMFDRQGRLRRHYLGQVDDIRLAAEIMGFVIEARDAPREISAALERRFASALVDPGEHDHDREGGCCGGHHDHAHDHSHDHDHAGGCCGGAHAEGSADQDPKQAKKAGCGDPDCGCKS